MKFDILELEENLSTPRFLLKSSDSVNTVEPAKSTATQSNLTFGSVSKAQKASYVILECQLRLAGDFLRIFSGA